MSYSFLFWKGEVLSSFGKGKYCIRVGQNTYQSKNKLFSYQFVVIPIRVAAFFYSTKFCLILLFYTNDYINLQKGVSERKQVRLFCNDLKSFFPFYRERGLPLRSELSKNFRSEEKQMKGNHPKRRKDKYNPYFIISTTRNRGSETRRCYKKHIYIRVFKSA